jgi:hypothetical protein
LVAVEVSRGADRDADFALWSAIRLDEVRGNLLQCSRWLVGQVADGAIDLCRRSSLTAGRIVRPVVLADGRATDPWRPDGRMDTGDLRMVARRD